MHKESERFLGNDDSPLDKCHMALLTAYMGAIVYMSHICLTVLHTCVLTESMFVMQNSFLCMCTHFSPAKQSEIQKEEKTVYSFGPISVHHRMPLGMATLRANIQ